MTDDNEFGDLIRERFAKLPPVVQNAITSAEVQQHLRDLANTHKLHIDQWDLLENEVQMTLLGIKSAEDLEKNLRDDVGVPAEEAAALASGVAEIVFEPIRQELERQLTHPDAVAKEESGVEQLRDQVLAQQGGAAAPEAAPTPTIQRALGTPAAEATPVAQPAATPAQPPVPAAAETEPKPQAVRAPISENYKPGTTSTERKSVHDDPYREAPL
jgi:hypothetical protein